VIQNICKVFPQVVRFENFPSDPIQPSILDLPDSLFRNPLVTTNRCQGVTVNEPAQEHTLLPFRKTLGEVVPGFFGGGKVSHDVLGPTFVGVRFVVQAMLKVME
jgi:hypothetical protein